jgi:amino acid adenylation domain-containing protein
MNNFHTSTPSTANSVADHDPFADADLAHAVPTTEPQREVWMASQLGEEASLAYNESVSLQLRGPLNVTAWQQALQDLVARHQALRATLSADGLWLYIAQTPVFDLPLLDLSALPAAEQTAAQRLAEQRAVLQPFDLVQGPLLRVELLRLSAQHHVLVLCAHHIVCDGWSFGVIAQELPALYAQHLGSKIALGEPDSYTDYATQQHSAEHLNARQADTAYWVAQYDRGPVPVLELPTDRPRTALRSTASARVDVLLDAPLVAAVRKLGGGQGASLFVSLLSLFAATLARLSGSDEVVVGVPAAGQAALGANALVGHCVSLLPLRLGVNMDQPAAALLHAVNRSVLDAYDHPHCGLGALLQKLQLPRDTSRLPLVSALFNLDSSLDMPPVGDLQLHIQSNPRCFETFDLFVNGSQTAAGVLLECQYNTGLFNADTVRRWLALYRTALERAVAQPALPLAELLAPTPDDAALLARFNHTAVDWPEATRIEALIAQQAAATPQAVAVTAGAQQLTYAELNARAQAVAVHLRAQGVGAGQLVGLACGRNEHLLVGLLGILKAGAGYVPLDPAFPAARLSFMVADAGLQHVVVDASVDATLPLGQVTRLCIDELRAADVNTPLVNQPTAQEGADDVAYVIYTSGSTGQPKGVRVAHRSVVNLLRGVQREPGMNAGHRVLAVTTLSFDIAVSELMLPLTVGACIVMASRAQATDGDRLRALVQEHSVNFIDATPSTWRLLLAAGWQGAPGLTAICTGEPLPPDLARSLLPRVGALWNGYGPTETTVWSSLHRVLEAPGPIPIGHPIANTQIHVLDAQGRALPVGVVGELYIGGAGVTLGYLNRPELTAERFVTNSMQSDELCYKTGDLGRWRADGVLECLGRSDHQIKLRGYRIELGEIEAQLAHAAQVDRAVVITREDTPGDARLVAYVVVKPNAPLQADITHTLREFLRATLPDYMLPQHVVSLAAIPLLPNGKINRALLPAVEIHRAVDAAVAARTPTEHTVASVMERVLALPGIGATENFFALGGHSLLASQLAAQLGTALATHVPLRAVFEAPTVQKLAQWLDSQQAKPLTIPHRPGTPSTAPTTAMQRGLWFVEQLTPGRAIYNTPSAHRLQGRLNVAALNLAWREVVRRQDTLRTGIAAQGNLPIQRVAPELPQDDLPLLDLGHLATDDERQAQLMLHLRALAAQPFELDQAPLFRVQLFRLSDEEHVFYFGPHHIIWDGWSFDIFQAEMSSLYQSFSTQQPPQLPELPLTYGDFAAWREGWLQSPEHTTQLAYWKEQLATRSEPLALVPDQARPAHMSGIGATTWMSLSLATLDVARQLARSASTTPFCVLLAAYAALLQRLTGQRTLLIGVPVRGRQWAELEGVMGLFVNVLPLRLEVAPDASFTQLVAHVRDVVLAAFKHPDITLDELVRELKLPRDRSRAPLWQAMFSLQDARQRTHHWGDLAHSMVHVMQPGLAEDLSLWLMERQDGLIGGMSHNTDILNPASAQHINQSFVHTLQHLLQNPRATMNSMPLNPVELETLATWNATQRSLPPQITVHTLIRANPATADTVALVCGAEHLTYGQLATRTHQLAHALAARGVQRGQRVGLCVERSVNMVIAMLAVLECGAAYVPLDPAYPSDRLNYMVQDAEMAVLITESAHAQLMDASAHKMLLLDTHAADIAARPATPLNTPEHQASAADCAYVIYTSGTTGKPKGVMVPHGAVVNFLTSMAQKPGLKFTDRLVAVTTLSFDIAVLELLLPLTLGAQVIIATRSQTTDPHALRALIETTQATAVQATPGAWRLLLQTGWTGGKHLKALVGGEALPLELAHKLLPVVGELWNMYGPTETTVWSTCARIQPQDASITIGQPIANTQVHILDEQRKPCPIGVVGEIWIGGHGVTLGYLNRPELTAERFLADQFSNTPDARMYRTGDRGRWRADGNIEHLGRIDFQVKVRGHRIELGEIEACLSAHASINQSVVVVREDTPGDARLVAYCVPQVDSTEPFNPATVREHLRRFLPTYMLPQHLIAIDAVPLLPNGKTDRAALPAPSEVETPRAALADSQPLTPTEQQLAHIWADLLKISDISPQDNFFDLGGHSLLAMQAILAMETRTSHSIDRNRFIFETLGQIARAYDEAAAAGPAPVKPPPQPGGLRNLVRGLFGKK